tara:strand:+ start:324 stop:1208 length:885 start_codon:yes stop_codon:yes gene_type:complete
MSAPNHADRLLETLERRVKGTKIGIFEKLQLDLPKRWERFDNVALLPIHSFTSELWDGIISDTWWAEVAEALEVERLFRKGEIKGERRESTAELLYGEGVDVERIEHGVRFVYRITECMFSQGNINERARMGSTDVEGEQILDLYAGIGYYTLPLLVSSKTAEVTATEWNPNAIRDLHKGLHRNGVENRCTVLEGDNRNHGERLQGRFNRVILGLLPQPWEGLQIAVEALHPRGGILHVHGIAPVNNPDSWETEVIDRLKMLVPNAEIQCIERIRVKSYAPHWDHCVLDVRIET